MVVRVWKATATAEGAAGYRRHFEDVVRPELLHLPGFLGARLQERRDAERVDIVVETLWDSLDAIRAFAGDGLDLAVVEPGARAVLSEFDDRVLHYDVVAELKVKEREGND